MNNETKNYFEKDVTCSKDCERCCENCKRNACGYCTHFGVQVSKNNSCENAAKRSGANI